MTIKNKLYCAYVVAVIFKNPYYIGEDIKKTGIKKVMKPLFIGVSMGATTEMKEISI
jgi:hypothetical protein